MSHFRPTRASPPPKLSRLPEYPIRLPIDVPRPPVAVPELMGLSSNEIELLDAVLERAGPSATAFLAVFKAYNDVLSERGLDPHEVLYYGKLLKLGTMKGKNWGDKWRMVKSQYNYPGSYVASNNQPHANGPKPTPISRPESAPRRVAPQITSRPPPEDTFTLHSHQDESDTQASADENIIAPYRSALMVIPNRNNHASSSKSTTSTLDDAGSTLLFSGSTRTPAVSHYHPRKHWEQPEVSDGSEEYVPSTTPPSYRAAIHDTRPPQAPLRPLLNTGRQPQPAVISSATARNTIARARERRGSVVNEDDAWNKIRMQRDEIDADQFRADRLQERCWEVWKQGFEWIITTNRQIGEARDNLLLRISLQRWRDHTASHLNLHRRITNLSDNRRLRKALHVWKSRLKEKEQNKWRHEMRLKMKIIKEKREAKLRKDAWTKWRQSHRSHFARQHYAERLVLQFYSRWKQRLSGVIEREATADYVFESAERKALERCWVRWRNASDVRNSERIMTERIELRLMGTVLDVWRKNAQVHQTANEFHRLLLMKTAVRSWKASSSRIKAMENRAVKHVARQDGVLLRAVARVWKARERGRLLERVKATRLLKAAWAAWEHRMQEQKQNSNLAVAFSMRIKSDVAASAFRKWREVYASHQNSYSFAMQYDSSQLRYKMLLSWRLHLRNILKRQKDARIANRFFATRRAWVTWLGVMKARKREKQVSELKTRKLAKVFRVWLIRTERQRQQRLAEQITEARVTKRILRHGLAIWTNRVIEIKLRELEVAQKYDVNKQSLAFKKWKAVCVRHAEELSLMESYQLVKREETMRRLFNRWSSLARTTRHRRLTLQKKEDEMKFSMIAFAWDKWRDRFSDEKLRPIEYNVLLQTQKNMLFRAFGIWHSKTKSLPAIRFHATNVKLKFFELWRRAMPRALQAKQARERDTKAVLAKYLDKWLRAHRTKMALKAVARARYLRLPTATPRQTRPVITASSTTRSIFARPAPKDDEDQSSSTRPAVVSLLRHRPGSEKSPGSRFSAPMTREPSPTRSRTSHEGRRPGRDVSPTRSAVGSILSAGGGEGGRSRLWHELREVQRKSRPSSLHSRTKDPP